MASPGVARRLLLVVVAVLASACGGPAEPSPVPRSLTVTAAVTGTQYQLVAVAGFSDGTTQDVTSQAGWRSSDSTVASVSAAGLVTPLANGSALITATYQGVTGNLALSVVAPAAPPSSPPPSPPPGPAPQTYTLAGVVRASPLDETVAGAGIEAMHGGRVVASATTDGSGFYTLTGLIAQEYVLSLSKVGYNARTSDVIIAADTTRDLVMDRNRVTLTGIARDAPPCPGLAIDSALVQVLDGPDAGKSSLTDRSGLEYSIAGVAWGTFRVRASRDGFATSDVTVTVSASNIVNGPFTQVFFLLRTARQTLSGEVRERRTENGARTAGVRVEIATGPDTGRATISDSLGRYRLEQLAVANVTVRATLPGFFDEVATTSLCGDRQLEIRLDAGGRAPRGDRVRHDVRLRAARRGNRADPVGNGRRTDRGDRRRPLLVHRPLRHAHRPRVEGRFHLRGSHLQRQGSDLVLELRPPEAVAAGRDDVVPRRRQRV